MSEQTTRRVMRPSRRNPSSPVTSSYMCETMDYPPEVEWPRGTPVMMAASGQAARHGSLSRLFPTPSYRSWLSCRQSLRFVWAVLLGCTPQSILYFSFSLTVFIFFCSYLWKTPPVPHQLLYWMKESKHLDLLPFSCVVLQSSLLDPILLILYTKWSSSSSSLPVFLINCNYLMTHNCTALPHKLCLTLLLKYTPRHVPEAFISDIQNWMIQKLKFNNDETDALFYQKTRNR